MINLVDDVHDVCGRDGRRRATRALVAGPDMAAMAKIGEALIGTLVDRRDGGARAFVRHVDAWLAGGVSPRIEDLVAVTRLSRRQVERKCNAPYGAPPKLLARKNPPPRAAGNRNAVAAGTSG